jgi:hypothetical protein
MSGRCVAPIYFDRFTPDVHGKADQAKVLPVYLLNGSTGSTGNSPTQCAGCRGANDTGGGPTTKVVGWPPLGTTGPLPMVEPRRLAPMSRVRNVKPIDGDSTRQPALLIYAGLLLGPSSTCATIDGFAVDYHTQDGAKPRSYHSWFPFQLAVCRKGIPSAARRLDRAAQRMRARVGRKVVSEGVHIAP